MIIEGEKFTFIDTIEHPITVPDCWVAASNKIGDGNGEAKLYVGPRDNMEEFYGGSRFRATCFVLRKDLIAYMHTIKTEYFNPSQPYRKRQELSTLWQERMNKIHRLQDLVTFTVAEQSQIVGSRGYVNSDSPVYKLIREISLPLVTYISTMKLSYGGQPMFYWKLFADFEEIEKRKSYIINYGSSSDETDNTNSNNRTSPNSAQNNASARAVREGQEEYRRKLLQECPFCPITMINEESLLIASHIKPWAVSEIDEKTDPNNGFILSPLYDKLFDKGFITFTDDKRVSISNWLSRQVKERIGIKENQFFQFLPLNPRRCEYLEYHRESVFKG